MIKIPKIPPKIHVLTVALCALLGCDFFAVAHAQSKIEANGEQMKVGVVSTLPSQASREMLEELRKAGNLKEPAMSLSFESFTTFGDESEAEKIAGEVRKIKAKFVIYLDGGCARLLRTRLSLPSVAILQSQHALEIESDPASSSPSVKPRIIETTPTAYDLAEILNHMQPNPTTLGLVYTNQDPANEEFVKILKQARDKSGRGFIIRECPLAPGACRNVTDIQYALDNSLSKLTQGSLIILLPSTNVQKFAFVFRNWAAAHQTGLVGVGECQSDNLALRLCFAPSSLAGACFNAIQHPAKNSWIIIPGKPQVIVEPGILKALGLNWDGKSMIETKAEQKR